VYDRCGICNIDDGLRGTNIDHGCGVLNGDDGLSLELSRGQVVSGGQALTADQLLVRAQSDGHMRLTGDKRLLLAHQALLLTHKTLLTESLLLTNQTLLLTSESGLTGGLSALRVHCF